MSALGCLNLGLVKQNVNFPFCFPWHFGLPNEVFRTEQGTTFDGSGIAPDIAVPVFADADAAAGRVPAMAKALEVLQKK